jgi:predicted DNA-binding ribbon-helix-helix protein
MRLESPFWDALKELANREQSDISELCTRIAKQTRYNNLSSAIRVAVMDYYRDLADGKEPTKAPERTAPGDD